MASREQTPVGACVSTLTHEYHLSVLRLAHQYSGTEIAWNVSQHVLDRLWDDDSSSVPNGGASKEVLPVAPSGSSSTSVSTYSCQACGYQLQPGWKGTFLRVKRAKKISSLLTKKTLKRREQRKLRRAARIEEMKPNDHTNGRRRNTASPSSSDHKDSAKERLVLLRNDIGIGRLDRNRLVLTCGRCRDKTYLKGLRREPKGKNTMPSPAASKQSCAPPSKTRDVVNLSESFERVPRLSRKPPPPKSIFGAFPYKASKEPAAQKMTLLEQRQGKRSKKKNNHTASAKKKSGNLHDFLSSLNDH